MRTKKRSETTSIIVPLRRFVSSLVAQRAVIILIANSLNYIFINNRYWPRVDGAAAIVAASIPRVAGKVIADFCGCLHLRHPFELGGVAFSLSMVWAQVFPFVALQFYDEDETIKDMLTAFLAASFTLWFLLNVAFFCSINLEYLDIFFGTSKRARPFEHPQGVFELHAFAVDWRRITQRRTVCIEAKRAVIALVANSLHQQQQGQKQDHNILLNCIKLVTRTT